MTEELQEIVTGLQGERVEQQRESLARLIDLTHGLPLAERHRQAHKIRPLLLSLALRPQPRSLASGVDPSQGGWPYIPEEREVQASLFTLALEALERWGQPADIPKLLSLDLEAHKLKRFTISRVAHTIVQIGGKQAIAYCVEALCSPQRQHVELSLTCLEQLPETFVLSHLQKQLNHKDPVIRAHILRVMGSFGPAAIPYLCDMFLALEDSVYRVRSQAIESISQTRSLQAIVRLIQQTDSPESKRRHTAQEVLSRFRSCDSIIWDAASLSAFLKRFEDVDTQKEPGGQPLAWIVERLTPPPTSNTPKLQSFVCKPERTRAQAIARWRTLALESNDRRTKCEALKALAKQGEAQAFSLLLEWTPRDEHWVAAFVEIAEHLDLFDKIQEIITSIQSVWVSELGNFYDQALESLARLCVKSEHPERYIPIILDEAERLGSEFTQLEVYQILLPALDLTAERFQNILQELWQESLKTLLSLPHRPSVVKDSSQKLLHILCSLKEAVHTPMAQKLLIETYACVERIQPKVLTESEQYIVELREETLHWMESKEVSFWREQWEESMFE